MRAVDFVRSLYLGDRACKGIAIESWNATVQITVDTISRVRNPSGEWDFYTAEDVADGVLVFEGVTFFELKNDGALPNDSINAIKAIVSGEEVEVSISIDSVAEDATHRETLLTLRCKAIHIEDPARPGRSIVD